MLPWHILACCPGPTSNSSPAEALPHQAAAAAVAAGVHLAPPQPKPRLPAPPAQRPAWEDYHATVTGAAGGLPFGWGEPPAHNALPSVPVGICQTPFIRCSCFMDRMLAGANPQCAPVSPSCRVPSPAQLPAPALPTFDSQLHCPPILGGLTLSFLSSCPSSLLALPPPTCLPQAPAWQQSCSGSWPSARQQLPLPRA